MMVDALGVNACDISTPMRRAIDRLSKATPMRRTIDRLSKANAFCCEVDAVLTTLKRLPSYNGNDPRANSDLLCKAPDLIHCKIYNDEVAHGGRYPCSIEPYP